MSKWVKVKGNPNYEVSDDGFVKSIRRNVIMKPFKSNSGYPYVKLIDNDGRRYSKSIHRIVAESFDAEDHSGFEINHIDGNKNNNSLKNLEWCTHKHNMRHAVDKGLFTPYQLPTHPHSGRRVRIVETGEIFNSMEDCASRIGGVRQGVHQCLNGQKITYKGYHFEEVP